VLNDHTVSAVQRWIDRFVVRLDLCPFARGALENGSVRFILSEASDEAQLLQALKDALELLSGDPNIETAFVVHPNVLADFYDFNQFLGDCDRLLVAMDLEGVFQIASFHPHYQFAQTEPADAENYSNRSPYPMLHILREQSVERAVGAYPDIDKVPDRNVETLNKIGVERLQLMWRACFEE
jgi:hypothetical protein